MISLPKISSKGSSKFTALCLNYYLPEYFPTVWNNSSYRVAADGGTNRLYNFFKDRNIRDYKYPDFISGDFDSITPEVRKIMTDAGVEIIPTPDQDYCDSQKALSELAKRGKLDPIVAIGSYGGRFDQTTANISALLWFKDARVFMYDSNNIMCWIKPEDNGIELQSEWCSGECCLLPFYKPVDHIETKGLKMDLSGKLDYLESSMIKNEAKDQVIMVKTSDPVLFVCKVRSFDKLPK